MPEDIHDADAAVRRTNEFIITPEEQEILTRTERALQIMNTALPLNTPEQYEASAASDFADMDGDPDKVQAAAERWEQGQSKDRWSGAYNLAIQDIPDEDFEQYVISICRTARALTPADMAFFGNGMYFFTENCPTLEDARLQEQLGDEWLKRFAGEADPKVASQRQQDGQDLILGLLKVSSGAARPTHDEIRKKYDALSDIYNDAYTLNREDKAQAALFDAVTEGAREISRRNSDTTNVRLYGQLFEKMRASGSTEKLEYLMRGAAQYASFHPLTETAIEGWTAKLLPALEADDPQIQLLYEPAQAAGSRRGHFGGADFIYHTYSQPITPANINELLAINREMPTSNVAKWEQNAQHGLTLGQVFGNVRDFVHDQSGDVHKLAISLIRYYETGDKKYVEPFTGIVGEYILDRSLYDIPVYEYRVDGNPDKETITPIKTLRRLAENTAPFEVDPPATSDAKLNELLTRLQGARGYSRWEVAEVTLNHVNTALEHSMRTNDIGMEPAMVEALAWLEHQTMDILGSLVYEDQIHAYRQPWFQAILKFQELTVSAKPFDETAFQQYTRNLTEERSFQKAYQMIVTHTRQNVSDLAKHYAASGTPWRSEGIWSANTIRQLIGLTDLRPAETKQGAKHRKELMTPAAMHNTGD